jgi:hypothetical protein
MLFRVRFSGDTGNALQLLNNGMKFTTYTNDNDQAASSNCGSTFNGGWWFNNCGAVCLACDSSSIFVWPAPDNVAYNLKMARMMIKPQ